MRTPSLANPFAVLHDKVVGALRRMEVAGELPADVDLARVSVDPPRDPTHGHAATNAALVLAKTVRENPMSIAERLSEIMGEDADVTGAQAARPGFVNLEMRPEFWQRQMALLLEQGEDYGRSDLGAGEKVNVEYCSANPTGRLHVGHARGTVTGDALAALLERAGFDVTREYYGQ